MLKKVIAKIPTDSIRVRLLAGMTLFLMPICIYLYYNSVYSAGILRAQAAETNKKLLTLNMQVIDNNLYHVSVYLADIMNYDSDLHDLQYSNDSNKRAIAKSSVFNTISNDITQFPSSIDAIFVYAAKSDDYFAVYNNSYSYEMGQRFQDFVKAYKRKNTLIQQKYYPVKINNRYFLFRTFNKGGLFIGAWVSADNLIAPLKSINAKDNVETLLVSSDGVAMNDADFISDNFIDLDSDFNSYYTTGKQSSCLVVGQKSTQGDFSIATVIPEKVLLQNLIFLRYIAYGIILLSILMIPLYIFYLKKIVIDPLFKIYTAIKRVNGGDINARIENFNSSFEFVELKNTFNKMMNQIEELKISVYEEKISKQKEELENLYLQINPHFILNSLHIIYSLAQIKDFKLIQDMSIYLSKYFGFITRSRRDYVLLGEEIDQLENYIRIQQLRFPDIFTYEINAPEDLLKTPVPSLILQTFVENTFKYALNMDDHIHLAVSISRESEKNELKFIISNTGKWFDEDILEQLRSCKRIMKKDGEHIGIWNIRKRLELIYGDKAKILFENQMPKGIKVTITIPC